MTFVANLFIVIYLCISSLLLFYLFLYNLTFTLVSCLVPSSTSLYPTCRGQVFCQSLIVILLLNKDLLLLIVVAPMKQNVCLLPVNRIIFCDIISLRGRRGKGRRSRRIFRGREAREEGGGGVLPLPLALCARE